MGWGGNGNIRKRGREEKTTSLNELALKEDLTTPEKLDCRMTELWCQPSIWARHHKFNSRGDVRKGEGKM